MSPDQVRVLVLYSHPLMGEGLGRMLAAEPGVIVTAVDIAETDAVNAAIASEPEVIVVEEGGAVDAADIVRRSNCALVLDVDITTTSAWTLRAARPSRPVPTTSSPPSAPPSAGPGRARRIAACSLPQFPVRSGLAGSTPNRTFHSTL